MKKLIAAGLALAMALPMAACKDLKKELDDLKDDLFADDSIVKFEELYTHKDPEGLEYDERKVLINKDIAPDLEEAVNAEAYPDTLKYDEDGNLVGFYNYDPTTGMADGYTDLTSGEFVEESVELGLPDESMMVEFAGSVTLGSVIYGKDNKAVSAYLYAFLADEADKEATQTALADIYGYDLEEESATVLVLKQDETAIDAQFAAWQNTYGQSQSDRSATGYAENLKLELGLKAYGVNPYKPYADITDPEGLTYDEKVILTSNGGYSFVDESLEKELTNRTDVIYGNEGKAVAHYIYYEFSSKEAADKLMNATEGNFYGTAQRLSDTVVMDQLEGQALQDVVQAYIGYGVMTDDSLESYVENAEESYFLMRYEQ